MKKDVSMFSADELAMLNAFVNDAAKEENKQVELFELPLFSQRWFDTEDSWPKDDIPTFSF